MGEEAFRWVITAGVALAVLCTVVMAGVLIALYRIASRFETKVGDVKARVEPIIDTVRKLSDENAPKISDIAGHVAEIAANAKDISAVAKDQAYRFGEVGRDIADRTKVRVAHMDAIVDDTVEQVHHAGDNMKAAVMKPVREAGAVFAGVRAAVSTLVDGRRPTINHITQDEEMFI